jgi:hypothetical protein
MPTAGQRGAKGVSPTIGGQPGNSTRPTPQFERDATSRGTTTCTGAIDAQHACRSRAILGRPCSHPLDLTVIEALKSVTSLVRQDDRHLPSP